MFGNSEATIGGNALKFYASLRWRSGAPVQWCDVGANVIA